MDFENPCEVYEFRGRVLDLFKNFYCESSPSCVVLDDGDVKYRDDYNEFNRIRNFITEVWKIANVKLIERSPMQSSIKGFVECMEAINIHDLDNMELKVIEFFLFGTVISVLKEIVRCLGLENEYFVRQAFEKIQKSKLKFFKVRENTRVTSNN